ncbi:FAD-linked oxidoreductase cheF [Cladobotryum mycophilum]|uniref:FAD-linked oxidoreductase cheF n=1 Tax=Cladobotryum mycophilum TaxID=491253 RepID=A0ABR0SW95_9HYPO
MAIHTRPRGHLAAATLFLYALASPVTSTTTDGDWQTLSNQVSGRLHQVDPLARPCYSTLNGQAVPVDNAQCSTIQQNYVNGSFRTDHYSGFFHLYGDGCISNITDQCFLNTQSPQAPLPAGAQCNQGLVSPHYLEVGTAQDVQAAFAFARKTGNRLSIKSSGHDYMSRSSLQGSLALWTRNLKQMTFHKTFQPATLGSKPVMAITFGVGVNSNEAQAFANVNNVTLVSPSSPTVAIVGGFSLFGGHSVLSPTFGLGVDRILEIEIVTPDGQHRICNAKDNSDLFWALRGAGGGSFGVILNVTVKVEPAIPITFALLSFTPTPQNTPPFLSLLINNTKTWSADGWGGPMGSSSLSLINTRLDEAASAKSLSAVADYVKSINGTVSFTRFATFYEFYSKFIAVTPGDSGTGPLLSFRVLPKRLHETTDGQAKLKDFLLTQISKGNTPTLFMTPPAQFNYTKDSTSMHPAWRNSYWDVGFNTRYAWNDTVDTRKQIAKKTQQIELDLQALAPDGAAYPNESNPWVKNWQTQYWGSNYQKLAQIKAKYDPYKLLDCWKCVGFQDVSIHSESAYECMGAFDSLA